MRRYIFYAVSLLGAFHIICLKGPQYVCKAMSTRLFSVVSRMLAQTKPRRKLLQMIVIESLTNKLLHIC